MKCFCSAVDKLSRIPPGFRPATPRLGSGAVWSVDSGYISPPAAFPRLRMHINWFGSGFACAHATGELSANFQMSLFTTLGKSGGEGRCDIDIWVEVISPLSCCKRSILYCVNWACRSGNGVAPISQSGYSTDMVVRCAGTPYLCM